MSATPIFNVPDLESRGAAPAVPTGGAYIEQGGQSLGETMVIGTLDAEDFHLIAQGGQSFLQVSGAQQLLEITPGSDGMQVNTDGPIVVIGNAIDIEAPTTISLEATVGFSLEAGDDGASIASTANVEIQSGTGPVQLIAGTDQNVEVRGGTTGGATGLLVHANGNAAGNTGALLLEPLAAGRHVALRAPDTLAASFYLTLPTAEPAHEGAALVVDALGQMAYGPSQQGGIANLTNGVSPTIPVLRMSASTRIFVQCGLAVPGAGNLTIGYRPLPADRTNGTPGNFKITACLNTGAINALDQTQGLMWSVEND